MKKIVILIPWIGPWPKWMGLYLESCRYNPTIDIVLICDHPSPVELPPNVRIAPFTMEGYRDHVAKQLGIKPKWHAPYKLCDIRPAMADIHPDLIEGYDFWGYGDIDVIYGDMRAFLTDEVLGNDVISAAGTHVSGHFCLIRNERRTNKAYRRALHWRFMLESDAHKSFDERIFSLLFQDAAARKKAGVHRFLVPPMGGGLLREQFSTALPNCRWIDGSRDFPETWYWNRGHLTASNAGDREFMYLHFSHWASKRWAGGDKAVWDAADPLIGVTDPHPTSFRISAEGFRDWAPEAAKVPELS